MRLNGGIIGASNEPSTRKSQGMFSFAERAVNVLYGQFQVFANTFTLKNLFNVQPQPTFRSLGVAGQDTVPHGLFLKPDGTKMYMVGSGSDNVRQYTLSTPYDLSTATFDSVSFLISQDTSPTGVWFRSDGVKMFVSGSGLDRVYSYTLSTPWVVSTASYDNSFMSASAQDTTVSDFFINSSGTILLILGFQNLRVYKYTISNAWNISTATYSNTFLSVSTQTGNPGGLYAHPSGTKIFVGSISNNAIFSYDLSTAWDLTTASYNGEYLTAETMTSPSSVYVTDDGKNLYWTDASNDVIRQYYLPSAWSLNQGVGFVGSLSVSAQDGIPQGCQISADGTKAYMIGSGSDAIYQYTLSTPFEIATGSYASKTFSVAGQDIAPTDLFFKSDGTKVYVCGQTNDRIYQYSLSTAWDISTASYDNISLSVAASELNPNGFCIGADGANLYYVSTTVVYQYALSTPWVVSSGTLVKTYNFSTSTNPVDNTGAAIALSSDGSTMFVLGNLYKFVYQFSLSTNWDVSTASPIDYIKYYVYREESAPTGLCFSPGGDNFYVVGSNSDRIYQYSAYP